MNEAAVKKETISQIATRGYRLLPVLSPEQRSGLLCYLLGVMSTEPEWPVLKEAVELYLKEYGIK